MLIIFDIILNLLLLCSIPSTQYLFLGDNLPKIPSMLFRICFITYKTIFQLFIKFALFPVIFSFFFSNFLSFLWYTGDNSAVHTSTHTHQHSCERTCNTQKLCSHIGKLTKIHVNTRVNRSKSLWNHRIHTSTVSTHG